MVSKDVETGGDTPTKEVGLQLQKGRYVEDRGVWTDEGGKTLQVDKGQKDNSRSVATGKGGEENEREEGAQGATEKTGTDDKDKKESKELRVRKLQYMGVTKPLGAH